MEEYSFDSLAKEMADGTISRGRALKLAGGAVLGAFGLAALPTLAQAKKKKKKKKKKHHRTPPPVPTPDPNVCSDPTCTPCGNRAACGCVPTIEGASTCADAATGPFTPCTTSATCLPSGRLCVNIGPTSCNSTPANFVCALPCISPISPPPPCGPDNCSGCCSKDGQCQPGTEQANCGIGGSICKNCIPSGGTCMAGGCVVF